MIFKHKFVALAVLVGAGMLGASGTAQAYSYRHIDRLAVQLERQAKTLHREVHAHFRPCPQFAHLDADVTKLERLARHIHDVAHRRGSISHIRADVNELDRVYHHVQGLVRAISYSGKISRREVWHFRVALSRLGNTIHHLKEDLNPHYGYGHGHFYDPHH